MGARLLAAASVLALATCRDSVAPPNRLEPVPGRLLVEFESPNADDGAAVLFIRGEGIRAATPTTTSYATFLRTTDSVWRVAVVGNLVSGPVLYLDVDDVNEAISGSVVEVATRSNVPRSTSMYFVRVRPVAPI